MTEEIYDNLKKYVWNGGKLFISVPHLRADAERNNDYTLINNGDYSDFLGCNIKGKGKSYNWGVKFIEESMMPGVLYPYTRNGVCDPICAAGLVTCTDIELTGGRITAILADKFVKWRSDNPSLIVENSYGEGFTSLMTAWDYPGSDGLAQVFGVMLKSIISAEQRNTMIKIYASDKVQYAVYEMGEERYAVYLLNTDFDNDYCAGICFKDNEMDLQLDSCSMTVAYITDRLMIAPVSNKFAVEEIVDKCDEILVGVIGSGEFAARVSMPDGQFEVKVDGMNIPLRKSGSYSELRVEINGQRTLIIKPGL